MPFRSLLLGVILLFGFVSGRDSFNRLNGNYRMTGSVRIPIHYKELVVAEEKYVDKKQRMETEKTDDFYTFFYYDFYIEQNEFKGEFINAKKPNSKIVIHGYITEDLQYMQQITVTETYDKQPSTDRNIERFTKSYSLQNLKLKDSKEVNGEITYLNYQFDSSISSIHETDMVFDYYKKAENDMRSSEVSREFLLVDREMFEKKLQTKLPPVEIKLFLKP